MNRNESGLAVSLEAAILLPAMVLFIGLLLSVGRLAVAQGEVSAVAGAAARAASIERSEVVAKRAAEEAAWAGLSERGLSCGSEGLVVDVSGLARAVGEQARVTVSLSCALSLADIALPGIPGSIEVRGTGSATVDQYRGQ